jgi:hypothetical protein
MAVVIVALAVVHHDGTVHTAIEVRMKFFDGWWSLLHLDFTKR